MLGQNPPNICLQQIAALGRKDMAESLLDITIKLHFEAQVKFCYYLLGLAVAILGLSVHFTTPSSTDIYPILVFFSWGTMILSLSAGIRWQQLWIKHTAELHGMFVELNRKKGNENGKPTSETNTSIQMFILEMVQVGMLIVGLVLIGTYKLTNFYAL